ncbi:MULTISPECIES: hypothetical protein [Nitratireductor]|uniref:hypothetical protein n=1 Tax=Nitratireductor TaxID=245876 RepID=UPI000FDB50AF|nr:MULTISPECIES: hypothetical protein [Nitratireductor]
MQKAPSSITLATTRAAAEVIAVFKADAFLGSPRLSIPKFWQVTNEFRSRQAAAKTGTPTSEEFSSAISNLQSAKYLSNC